MQLVRCAFDPASLCNPGKIFPTPRLCGEVPGHRRGPRPAARERRGDLLMSFRTEAASSVAQAEKVGAQAGWGLG